MKKALIFYGGWDGHTPVETSGEFAKILTENGFDVTVSKGMDCLNDYETLKQYDLIIPAVTMSSIEWNQSQNITKAVAEGSGLAGWHGGMCDSFRQDTEWQFMTGSQWVAHPGGEIPYRVNLIEGNIFTEGLNDFDVVSEQYYIHVDPAAKVYATTTFPTFDGPHASNGDVKVPVVYTKMWGKGKVFYMTIGHTYKMIEIPEVKEMMRRGFIWAAREAEE